MKPTQLESAVKLIKNFYKVVKIQSKETFIETQTFTCPCHVDEQLQR